MVKKAEVKKTSVEAKAVATEEAEKIDFLKIEQKWQKKWEAGKVFEVKEMKNYKKAYRVRASVYPTSHNKIWLSSGRVPLYDNHSPMNFINLPLLDFFARRQFKEGEKLEGEIKENLGKIGWEV